jgi:hypothetical protein
MEASKVMAGIENTVVVPIVITNQVELSALDIPLSFNEGVTLKEVQFEGTRVDYFDVKLAGINNEDRTVVIGLLPQLSQNQKPRLEAGSGEIARLVFEVNDPAVETITIEPIVMENPNHSLAFVHTTSPGVHELIEPDFTGTSVALSGVNDNLPTSFALNQNYPNPFNPTTIISFALPIATHVTLDIYNVLGQRVTTLVDGQMDAGPHEVEWDAAGSSSGVYFYRISAQNFSETKKMLLLK